MLSAYRDHVAERAAQGIPPLPLNTQQAADLVELLQNPPAGEEAFLLSLLRDRIPPGVDQAAYVKAGWLTAIAKGETTSSLVSPAYAVELLGTMVGGYNVQTLIDLLSNDDLGDLAATALKKTLLVFDAFNQVLELSKTNPRARAVIESWAAAEWFTSRPPLPETLTVTVFKVTGEINTDDFSPAAQAFSRPDIPLHALSMLDSRDPEGLQKIEELKQKGYPVAFVGDVVGTGSSRKSAINSVLWHTGNDRVESSLVARSRQFSLTLPKMQGHYRFNAMFLNWKLAI